MRSMVSPCHHDLAGTVCSNYCFWLASVWMLVPFRLITHYCCTYAMYLVTTMPDRCWCSLGFSLVGQLRSPCGPLDLAATCNMHIAIYILSNIAKYSHHQLNYVLRQFLRSDCTTDRQLLPPSLSFSHTFNPREHEAAQVYKWRVKLIKMVLFSLYSLVYFLITHMIVYSYILRQCTITDTDP